MVASNRKTKATQEGATPEAEKNTCEERSDVRELSHPAPQGRDLHRRPRARAGTAGSERPEGWGPGPRAAGLPAPLSQMLFGLKS